MGLDSCRATEILVREESRRVSRTDPPLSDDAKAGFDGLDLELECPEESDDVLLLLRCEM